MHLTTTTVTLFAVGLVAANARGDDLVGKTLAAQPCNPCVVHVDGALDDLVWQTAARGGDFVQESPNELQPANELTTVQVAFDAENLFVAVHAQDSAPDGIQATLARRDSEPPSDWIHLGIDSYADRRTAFEFTVNAAGVQVDALLSEDVKRDLAWDAQWEVATQITADGWNAEFRIPLGQLRFSDAAASDWGFQVQRNIARTKEVDNWSPRRQADNRIVSRFGVLTGLREVHVQRSLQLLPYGLLSLTKPPLDATWSSGDLGLGYRLGGDVKYMVSSNLTLNATILPDFGQVEADPSVVNLTAFETYFAEKRPFFLEGAEILRFGLGIGDGDLGLDSLYYSRRIGSAPLLEPSLADEEEMTRPEQAEILGAAKLSGKSASGMSVAILDAVTNEERATIDGPNGRRTPIASPLTNYSVARLQQDFGEGRTSVGGMLTSVTRDVDSTSAVPVVGQATTGGIDVAHRWNDDEWQLLLSLAGSDLRGSSAAIDAVQTSSAHYFQRPDNDHTDYDPTRSSLSGYAGTLTVGKTGGVPWRYAAFMLVRSPGFEPNDMGYMQLADFIAGALWGGYRNYEPGAFFRKIELNANVAYGTNYGGDALIMDGNLSGQVQFLNYWSAWTGTSGHPSQLDTTRLRGGPALLSIPGWASWLGGNSDDRRAVYVSAEVVYSENTIRDLYVSATPSLVLRPVSSLRIELAPKYIFSRDDRQYVDTVDDGTLHYVVGHLHQETWSFTTRVDYTLTPALTLQVYAEPFVSAGAFHDYREVVAPQARHYEDRFAPYAYADSADFNVKAYRHTVVLRWEYRLGSTLFLVWSQGRSDEETQGKLRLGRDLSRLFELEGENVILAKLNIWLDV